MLRGQGTEFLNISAVFVPRRVFYPVIFVDADDMSHVHLCLHCLPKLGFIVIQYKTANNMSPDYIQRTNSSFILILTDHWFINHDLNIIPRNVLEYFLE